MPEQKSAEKAAGEGGTEGRRRIDLSVAQVAASALAAVVGALLASELGVYGTILGAAVVSLGATTGGAVFQHVFRRTGEHLRDAVDRTGPGPEVNGLRQVPASGTPATVPAISPEWNAPQVVRARRRWTWKTSAAVSGLVFLLAMTPIVAFELATGQPVSATVKGEAGSGTSLGGTVSPKPQAPSGRPAGDPTGGPSGVPSRGGASPSAGKDGGASAPASPGASPSAGSGGKASPSSGPSSTPSAGRSTGPSTEPSAGASGAASPSGGAGPSGEAAPQPPAPSGAPAAVSPQAAAPTDSR
ncbi:hypothetical protein OG535_26750 [Kitasatospora sp. NBC_00085]|uniref:hypothetical protein n=1 Tax=unclassified Kitasatospora TaxID=2633591 RepID=UPI00324FD0FF